jgi:hypothetical protein
MLKRLDTGRIFEELKEDTIKADRGSVAIKSGEFMRDTKKLIESVLSNA